MSEKDKKDKKKGMKETSKKIRLFTPEKRMELLADEYRMLQDFYQDMDRRALTIKGWGITVGMTALAAGFEYSKWALWVAVIAALMFWYLEAFWRNLAFFFSERIKLIENAIREEQIEGIMPMQVYNFWEAVFAKKGAQTRRYFFKVHVMIPYLFIVFVGLVVFFLI